MSGSGITEQKDLRNPPRDEEVTQTVQKYNI